MPPGNRTQRLPYLPWLVRDLRVRETQWREPRGDVRLVSDAIRGLLSWRAVIPQAIGLDNQTPLGRVEVDPEAIHHSLGLGRREPCRTIGRKRRSSSESVRTNVWRSRIVRSLPTPRCPRRSASADLRVSGSVRSRLSASLIARSRGPLPRRTARSTRVRTGAVRGMPSRFVTSAGFRVRRWAITPPRRRKAPPGTETSINPGRSPPISHSAAALPSLSTAPGPQDSTAAIQRPCGVSCGRPTAYTPRRTGWRRPNAMRCLIACGWNPRSRSCARATTPCWRSASSHTARELPECILR